ncbi:hypothetical protein ACHQM5_003357 [Ranunculus cassubicifolius]
MAGEEEKSLERTPTWAVAGVYFILIVISFLMEHIIHHLSQLFKKKRKPLYHALSKIQSELMLFGFLSLLLTVTKDPVAKICIAKGAAETFLPCIDTELSSVVEDETYCQKEVFLVATRSFTTQICFVLSYYCFDEQGKVSLLSEKGVEELQILIFVLAFHHAVSCIVMFGLGMAKARHWKAWEEETQTFEYQSSHDPRRFRLTRQTTFALRHLQFWSENRLLRWPVCFLRQFTGSVSKTDYTTLRHGFITAHIAEGGEFNFHKYLKRTLDKDLQDVVGVSIWNWMFCVFFIFFNSHVFYNYLWLPFVPLAMLLLVGTKLQLIITKMGLHSHNRAAVTVGSLVVEPHDDFFWFSRPRLLLHLIHFILFLNSFQLAFFTWTSFKFGMNSCFHRSTSDIVIKLVVGTLVQFLCGYVTLPLYALVTQMGSSIKKEAFTEEVIVGLNKWHHDAKVNVSTRSSSVGTSSRIETLWSGEPSSSHISVDMTEETEDVPHDENHIDIQTLPSFQ